MMSTPYEARFSVGESVRVKHRDALEQFARDWRYHNPLTAEQLSFADMIASVSEVGFYHGGDPLYKLDQLPGVWHEVCLAEP